MTMLSRKLWFAGIVLVGAIGYLAYAGAQQGWVYYVPVDQYVKDAAQQKHRVRLMGRVATDGLVVEAAQLRARFALEAKGARLPVNYHGTIPDLFKADVDVVVEGKLNPATHTFDADVLLTKCASKYDAKHQAALATTEKEK
jgi:cytochrome c-type biogenesis protein CcmE